MDVRLVAFLFACLLPSVCSEGAVEYCYNSPKCNASTWATISPKQCNGTNQSPINIVTANVKSDSNLTAFSFSGFNVSANIMDIENVGHSVKCVIDGYMASVSGGGLKYKYNTTQFHLHWGNGSSVNGSEHTVDGRQYAMELHIVNSRADLSQAAAVNTSDGLAVLGFFIEATNDSGKPESWKNLTSFLKNITTLGESLDITNQLTLDSLLQGVDRTKYYRYTGSLTVPPCNEAVVWTVFKDPIKVSKDLIDLFSKTVRANTTADEFITNIFRPTLPLNGRVVTSQPAATQPSSACTLHHTLSISVALLYYVFHQWV